MKCFKVLIAAFFLLATQASGEASLSIDDYLAQVQHSNPGYQGKKQGSSAQLATSQASSLLFSPQFFTHLQYIYDTRRTMIPAIQGLVNEKASGEIGLRKQTDFGLQLELAFNINHITLFGADPNIVTDPSKYILWVSPQFNLSLWQNFRGSMDQASLHLAEAQAKAESFGNSYEAKAMLVDAEARYWKLAALREIIHLQKDSFSRASAIRDMNEEKRKNHLIDESDVLLSQAAVRGKDLELHSMRDEALTAARSFNAARGVDSDEAPEALAFPPASEILTLPVPTRGARRGDIRAAEQASIAASAGSEVARQKLLPTLNFYGSIYAAGLIFALPLDFDSVSSLRDGYAQQKKASDLTYQKKLLDEQSEWNDLLRRFSNAKERLQISLDLEKVQKEKYASVQKRKANGLTIAFQVFQYELDYLSSALNRVQLQGLILGLRAQMKLYEDL